MLKIDWKGIHKNYKPWVRLKLEYIMNYEYGHKLGDCITWCDVSKGECPNPRPRQTVTIQVLNIFRIVSLTIMFLVHLQRLLGKCWYAKRKPKIKSSVSIMFAKVCYRLGKSGTKLSPKYCKYNLCSKGTIAHEMMHTLGFNHEMARHDRDNYIVVVYPNIEVILLSLVYKLMFLKCRRGGKTNSK